MPAGVDHRAMATRKRTARKRKVTAKPPQDKTERPLVARERPRVARDRPLVARERYVFRGIIQGVGFRPTVYRCATRLGLTGFVQNRRSEVVAEIQGDVDSIGAFLDTLRDLLPAPAHIDGVTSESIAKQQEDGFRIVQSLTSAFIFPPIPPDLALCDECRSEVLDPADRRYLYPFITCTHCGPRYSIVEDTPFDRDKTSMVDFPQCPACLEEYTNPENRRFHSQTNSCPLCGPRLTLINREGTTIGGDPIRETIKALKGGRIIAIQGVGGFHLAVNPSFDRSMQKLRSDKERERKPFALMVRDLEEAKKLCQMHEGDEGMLCSPESPILILPIGEKAPAYLNAVSDTQTLGIMLPYTPLHLLLFFHPEAAAHPEADEKYRHLVMTSGNLKGEPIITQGDTARRKLADIADLYLLHNRRIIFRTDDSVLRPNPPLSQKPPLRPNASAPAETPAGYCLLRRSRGFVPKTVILKRELTSCTLAVGGDLKNAPAFARGNRIYLSPYIGDLDNLDTMEAFESQIQKILSLFRIGPDRLVCDTHPLYRSTRWAQNQGITNKVHVQHHHAHILSVMAEYDLEEVLGLSFDGTGYGTDETIWGGEFLHCTRSSFTRLGSFKNFALPGGDAAVLHPIRIAISILQSGSNAEKLEKAFHLPSGEFQLVLEMIRKGINAPLTSALGRIFDAGAAALGLVERVSYEGEGPIRMEGYGIAHFTKQVPQSDTSSLGDLLPLHEQEEGRFRFDPFPLINHLLENRQREPLGSLCLEFHRAVSLASLRGVVRMRESTGINRLALSGGVFQNMLLRRLLIPALEAEGFEVYTNRSIPPGDGGLAVGQAYYSGK